MREGLQQFQNIRNMILAARAKQNAEKKQMPNWRVYPGFLVILIGHSL
jgi:hypothetical protein